ncbi:hypothetical protein IB265_33065 [Ensifer sp. ENS10]|uniref:hypothetical protein n=1 Tax=Ensifer sp. ENS10 TaxID=2769286 RepID=UPI00177AB914|nr:hypothetical protein [Ensifer sp. ENS10]MBD9511589.1 hypothetical protein [Ensifer sp. ENS10]
MKTLHLTNQQHELVVAVLDAIQNGADARTAAQRTMERFEDVQPVGEGSEEEGIIWGLIGKTFDQVRQAPDMIISRDQMSRLWDRYYSIIDVEHEGEVNPDQQRQLRDFIKEAPRRRRRNGVNSGYWIYEDAAGNHLAVGVHLSDSRQPCMCDENIEDVMERSRSI